MYFPLLQKHSFDTFHEDRGLSQYLNDTEFPGSAEPHTNSKCYFGKVDAYPVHMLILTLVTHHWTSINISASALI